MRSLKIAGLTRIRNEALTIKEHLDAMAEYCTAGIYVFDDASEDDTVAICKKHPAVKSIIGVKKWDGQRELAIIEREQRQALVEEAQKDNPEWFVYLDADERLMYNFEDITDKIDFVCSALFDFYITEEDKDRKYTGNLVSMRRWCGPEFRQIVSVFRNTGNIKYTRKNSRNPEFSSYDTGIQGGLIKHYGKAISIENWEKRCDFYINRAPEYAEIWKSRKGKAVHSESDFNRPLRTWSEAGKKAIMLSAEDYTSEQFNGMTNYK